MTKAKKEMKFKLLTKNVTASGRSGGSKKEWYTKMTKSGIERGYKSPSTKEECKCMCHDPNREDGINPIPHCGSCFNRVSPPSKTELPEEFTETLKWDEEVRIKINQIIRYLNSLQGVKE